MRRRGAQIKVGVVEGWGSVPGTLTVVPPYIIAECVLSVFRCLTGRRGGLS